MWRVITSDGSFAALKFYDNGHEQDEGPGLGLMAALNGVAMAQVLARGPGAVLMEYLPGQSLGDLARAGDDLEAAVHLATVATRLHGAGVRSADLTPLDERCRPLFQADAADPPIAQTQALATWLLSTSPAPCALHGDLHHDNILHGPRGWCAIDAKGVWGDPAYDFANAFRNPVGLANACRDPDRFRALTACFSHVSGLPPDRLRGWAAVHVCLSVLWDRDKGFADHPDRDLPSLFLNWAQAG